MLISVIIPARDAAGTLPACLDALAACGWRGHEVIVVDDGSTDATAIVARDRGARVVRVDSPGGPATARNRGAELAEGAVLFFVDADVCVHLDALERVASHLASEGRRFGEDPRTASVAKGADAVFGSYDDTPRSTGFFGRYKNLFHHYVHQNGAREASTFWAGCGAVRKDVFLSVGGFDESYVEPSVEDIDLGYRLRDAGRHILLDPELQGTHLKSWTFRSMVGTDISRRALPWLRLLRLRGSMPSDLNIDLRQRASVTLLFGACTAAVVSVLLLPAAGAAAAGACFGLALLLLVVVAYLNRGLYAFFRDKEGPRFALRALPVHLLYLFYCGASTLWVFLRPGGGTGSRAARSAAVPRLR